jgi:hypothetical protein
MALGAWKRSIKRFGKVSCRHVGCNVESKTVEETLEHYLNCPMAPKKVNITKGLEMLTSCRKSEVDSMHCS